MSTIKELRADLYGYLNDLGFEECSAGGGCTALYAKLDRDVDTRVFITAADEPDQSNAPLKRTKEFLIGIEVDGFEPVERLFRLVKRGGKNDWGWVLTVPSWHSSEAAQAACDPFLVELCKRVR